MDYVRILTLLAADIEADEITGDAIQVFVNFFLAIGMFLVLFLPLLLIPYIFIKLGSVAGKVQAKMNSGARAARRYGTRKGKEAYKNSGYGMARQMRRDARAGERRRRTLEGKGLGGSLFKAEGALSGRLPRTAGQMAGDLRMTDAVDEARRKIENERIDAIHRNMSGNVATAISEGYSPSQLRSLTDSSTGLKRFTSAEDLAALDYLDRSGAAAQPDAAFATATMRKLMDIENVPGTQTDPTTGAVTLSPEIAVNNIARFVGNDQQSNVRFNTELKEQASKHGYKNLAYGNVTDGVFTNYTEAGKTPQKLVDGGLGGINKDMLDDAQIQRAITNKVEYQKDLNTGKYTSNPKTPAEKSAAQLEIIQQTMHIDKDESIAKLANQLKLSVDTVQQIRQSINSKGTKPMPPGF